MNAAKKSQQSWEALNEERFIFLIDGLMTFNRLILSQVLITLNLLAFVTYKVLILAGLLFRVIFLTSPLVRFEREESWIYRQIK
jgi:hypothetical protein